MERLFDFLFELIEDLIPWATIEPEDEGVLVRNLPFVKWLYRACGRGDDDEDEGEPPLFWTWGGAPHLVTYLNYEGQLVRPLKPGFYWKLSYLFGMGDNIVNDNVKWQNTYLEEQVVRSKDGTRWIFRPVVRYAIRDIVKAVIEVQDRDDSFQSDAAALLAEWVCEQYDPDITIPNIIANCQTAVKRCGTRWGCEVASLGITTLADTRIYRLVTDVGGD
jgi:hypothetical protein